jgi:hypothetical protein
VFSFIKKKIKSKHNNNYNNHNYIIAEIWDHNRNTFVVVVVVLILNVYSILLSKNEINNKKKTKKLEMNFNESLLKCHC